MLDNFFLLKEISKFLDEEISGYTIKEIFTQEKDKLILDLFHSTDLKSKYIEFSSNEKFPYIVLKNKFSKAKKNVLNLFKDLYDLEIKKVYMYNEDRIIKIELSKKIEIIFVFFKSKYNFVVISDGEIIDSFKNKNDLVGHQINILFSRKNEKSGKSYEKIKDFYRSRYRHYGELIYKEILYELNIDGERIISDELVNLIDNKIDDINKRINLSKYLIYRKGTLLYPSLISLRYLNDFEIYEYENINQLINAYIKFFYNRINEDKKIKSLLLKKEVELKKLEKVYKSLKNQFEYSKNFEELKNYGDLILTNIQSIKKGDEKLILEREEYPEKIEIKLKRELSPSENAQIYYEKYKKQKNSIEILTEKLKKLEYKIEKYKNEIIEIKNTKNLKPLKMTEKALKQTDETAKFRKFIIENKYEVWVGKDSASNDLLTTRYSSQSDLWFHVRGVSGSHTVLKISDKKNPPNKKVIEKAASIAAYYSKARNASNVPVAFCEKKYVKKRKGFKEGSVVMEREKVIFVKPGLPEEQITDSYH